jgi:hypothetical protein
MRHRTPTFACLLGITLALSGCGGGTPTATPAVPAPEEAISRIGDITIRATVVPTAALNAEVARRYGIERNDQTILLLVGVRQGADAQEVALPATITATVTNLRGQRQQIALRELRSEPASATQQPLLDYVGTVETTLPDTLQFDLDIVRAGGAHSTMQFSREFYPR